MEEDSRLGRSLSFWHYVAINIGAIIGAGWLFAPLGAAAFAGGSMAIAAWLIDGALTLFMALAYAELARLAPRTGAVVRYPQMAHGDLVGFATGALYLVSIASLAPAEAMAVVTYLSYYVGGLVRPAVALGQTVPVLTPKGLLLAVAIVAAIFAINYFGVRLVGWASLALMVWKVAVPLVAIAALLAVGFDASNLFASGPTEAQQAYHLTGLAAAMMAIPITGVAYATLGFRQAVEYSGEGSRPSRDVPLAVVASVALSLAIFVLLQVAFVGAIRWSEVHPVVTLSNGTTVTLTNETLSPGQWASLASSTLSSSPLATELALLGLGGLGALMVVDSWVSPFGNAVVQMGNLARVVYGMAANGHLPRGLRSLNRYAVPGLGLVVALALGLLFMVPLPSWYAIGSFAVLTTLLTYVTGGTALGVFGAEAGGGAYAYAVGLLGAVSAALLAYWAGAVPMMPVFVAFLGALAAYAVIRSLGGPAAEKAVAAGYAAAVAVTSYFMLARSFYPLDVGQAGPSAALYFWASFAASAAATAAALAALAAIDGGAREHLRLGAWYVALVFAIVAVDALGPFGLAAAAGDPPQIPFPYDLAVVSAVAAAAYAASVLAARGRASPRG